MANIFAVSGVTNQREQETKETRISIDANYYHINYYITLFIFIRI